MDDVYLIQEYKALGTVWYIEVFDVQEKDRREKLSNEIIEMIILFENTFSRFKNDSLLSTLNTTRHVSYNQELAEMLTQGKEATVKSDGLFDLFIKDKLVEKGYGEDSRKLKVKSEKLKVDTHTNAETGFIVTKDEITLAGMKSVDLGGIGKGYLIDKIAEYLRLQGAEEFLINGGGDIYVTHERGKPVELFLKHPTQPDEVVGSVTIMNKAFCSSSSYVRMWEKGGKKHNHFITHDDKEVWAASYVVGGAATTTDIAATVLCLASDDKEKMKAVADRFGVSYLVYDSMFQPFGNLEYKKSV